VLVGETLFPPSRVVSWSWGESRRSRASGWSTEARQERVTDGP